MVKKIKTDEVKARSKVSRQVKKTSPALSFDSPDTFFVFQINHRRLAEFTLIADSETKLRPLKCKTLTLASNLDFAYLTAVPKAGTDATVQKWRDCFSLLGHDHDFVAQLSKAVSVAVPKPVCVEYTSKQLVFCFLLPPKPRVSIE
jgi:hypothetical protein